MAKLRSKTARAMLTWAHYRFKTTLEASPWLAETFNMQYAVMKGLLKSARIVGNVLTKMQMQRLASHVNAKKFGQFRTREEALTWLGLQ